MLSTKLFSDSVGGMEFLSLISSSYNKIPPLYHRNNNSNHATNTNTKQDNNKLNANTDSTTTKKAVVTPAVAATATPASTKQTANAIKKPIKKNVVSWEKTDNKRVNGSPAAQSSQQLASSKAAPPPLLAVSSMGIDSRNQCTNNIRSYQKVIESVTQPSLYKTVSGISTLQKALLAIREAEINTLKLNQDDTRSDHEIINIYFKSIPYSEDDIGLWLDSDMSLKVSNEYYIGHKGALSLFKLSLLFLMDGMSQSISTPSSLLSSLRQCRDVILLYTSSHVTLLQAANWLAFDGVWCYVNKDTDYSTSTMPMMLLNSDASKTSMLIIQQLFKRYLLFLIATINTLAVCEIFCMRLISLSLVWIDRLSSSPSAAPLSPATKRSLFATITDVATRILNGFSKCKFKSMKYFSEVVKNMMCIHSASLVSSGRLNTFPLDVREIQFFLNRIDKFLKDGFLDLPIPSLSPAAPTTAEETPKNAKVIFSLLIPKFIPFFIVSIKAACIIVYGHRFIYSPWVVEPVVSTLSATSTQPSFPSSVSFSPLASTVPPQPSSLNVPTFKAVHAASKDAHYYNVLFNDINQMKKYFSNLFHSECSNLSDFMKFGSRFNKDFDFLFILLRIIQTCVAEEKERDSNDEDTNEKRCKHILTKSEKIEQFENLCGCLLTYCDATIDEIHVKAFEGIKSASLMTEIHTMLEFLLKKCYKCYNLKHPTMSSLQTIASTIALACPDTNCHWMSVIIDDDDDECKEESIISDSDDASLRFSDHKTFPFINFIIRTNLIDVYIYDIQNQKNEMSKKKQTGIFSRIFKSSKRENDPMDPNVGRHAGEEKDCRDDEEKPSAHALVSSRSYNLASVTPVTLRVDSSGGIRAGLHTSYQKSLTLAYEFGNNSCLIVDCVKNLHKSERRALLGNHSMDAGGYGSSLLSISGSSDLLEREEGLTGGWIRHGTLFSLFELLSILPNQNRTYDYNSTNVLILAKDCCEAIAYYTVQQMTMIRDVMLMKEHATVEVFKNFYYAYIYLINNTSESKTVQNTNDTLSRLLNFRSVFEFICASINSGEWASALIDSLRDELISILWSGNHMKNDGSGLCACHNNGESSDGDDEDDITIDTSSRFNRSVSELLQGLQNKNKTQRHHSFDWENVSVNRENTIDDPDNLKLKHKSKMHTVLPSHNDFLKIEEEIYLVMEDAYGSFCRLQEDSVKRIAVLINFVLMPYVKGLLINENTIDDDYFRIKFQNILLYGGSGHSSDGLTTLLLPNCRLPVATSLIRAISTNLFSFTLFSKNEILNLSKPYPGLDSEEVFSTLLSVFEIMEVSNTETDISNHKKLITSCLRSVVLLRNIITLLITSTESNKKSHSFIQLGEYVTELLENHTGQLEQWQCPADRTFDLTNETVGYAEFLTQERNSLKFKNYDDSFVSRVARSRMKTTFGFIYDLIIKQASLFKSYATLSLLQLMKIGIIGHFHDVWKSVSASLVNAGGRPSDTALLSRFGKLLEDIGCLISTRLSTGEVTISVVNEGNIDNMEMEQKIKIMLSNNNSNNEVKTKKLNKYVVTVDENSHRLDRDGGIATPELLGMESFLRIPSSQMAMYLNHDRDRDAL